MDNQSTERLLKFVCAALAVEPQAFAKLYRVEEWRPVQVEVTRHSQLLAVTWEHIAVIESNKSNKNNT